MRSSLCRALAWSFTVMLVALASPQAEAGPVQVVASCGAQSLPAGTTLAGEYMDVTGTLCTTGGSGSLTNYAIETGGNLQTIAGTVGPVTAGAAASAATLVACVNQSATPTSNQQAAVSCDGNGAVKVTAGVTDGTSATNQTYGAIGTKAETTASAATNGQISAASMVPATRGIRMDIASVGGVVPDACQTVARTYTPINISTATTTRIIAPASAKKTYICGIALFAAGADNVGVVEGTGGTCGTGTAGIIGGTTAASGVNLTANQGFILQNTGQAQLATAGTNVDLCLITSAAVQLSGHVSWVQQ